MSRQIAASAEKLSRREKAKSKADGTLKSEDIVAGVVCRK
jgi:hypothetical protein